MGSLRREAMRRVTIDMDVEELMKFEENPVLRKLKSLEILQFLKESPEEFAAIFRIEFNDEDVRIEELLGNDEILEIQELDREAGGARTYFLKSRPAFQPHEAGVLSAGGYMSVPFEIKDGRVRMTYLGTFKNVRAFLANIEKLGVKYRVASISDAKFPRGSPMARLTERQRQVLVAAYRLGYYDDPRRISSQQLADRLKIGSSTLVEHRRRAERLLLSELIGE
jgi:DNA-binding CsgD family transcriptional regulator